MHRTIIMIYPISDHHICGVQANIVLRNLIKGLLIDFNIWRFAFNNAMYAAVCIVNNNIVTLFLPVNK